MGRKGIERHAKRKMNIINRNRAKRHIEIEKSMERRRREDRKSE